MLPMSMGSMCIEPMCIEPMCMASMCMDPMSCPMASTPEALTGVIDSPADCASEKAEWSTPWVTHHRS